jgi:hypothetical protein
VVFTAEDREADAPANKMNRTLADGCSIKERWPVHTDGDRLWGSGLLMPLRGTAGGFVKLVQECTAGNE